MRKSSHLFLLVFCFFIPLLFTACASNGVAVLSSSTLPDPNNLAAPSLVFSGKVTNPNTGEWKNDYMVFVFLDGEEIGRQVSHLGKLAQSGDGVHDGLFKIVVSNTYELTPEHIFINHDHKQIDFENVPSSFGRMDYMYTWFGELSPGGVVRIDVPEKQIEYAIKIMPTMVGDETAVLPSHGHAILTENGGVILKPNTEEIAEQSDDKQPMATPTAPSNDTQTTSGENQPGTNKIAPAFEWSQTITNFHGNRWEVWVQYRLNQIPGLTFAQFKDEVLIHNPQLVIDSFVFYPHYEYIIPKTK
jgi:hypothetical protein